jgi:hypothetical protein
MAHVTCGVSSLSCGAEPPLNVHFIRLSRAVYVWIGVEGASPTMASLAAAVPGRDSASSAALIGSSLVTEDLGARLSRRLGCPVLMSFDGADGIAADLPEIEAQLFKLLKQ